jgi:hypothetical protein
MARVIGPPTNLTKAERAARRSVYLAGTFEPASWRDDVIAAVADLDVDVYDPRAACLETRDAADLASGAFAGRLSWQLANAAEANVVIVWLPPRAPAVTALLHLGFLAAKRGGAKRGSSVIVGGPEGPANDIVKAFAANTRVFYMGALADAIRGARYELTRTDL